MPSFELQQYSGQLMFPVHARVAALLQPTQTQLISFNFNLQYDSHVRHHSATPILINVRAYVANHSVKWQAFHLLHHSLP